MFAAYAVAVAAAARNWFLNKEKFMFVETLIAVLMQTLLPLLLTFILDFLGLSGGASL